MAPSLQVHLATLAGEHTLTADEDYTVKDLKFLIQRSLDKPHDSLLLCCGTRTLRNAELLSGLERDSAGALELSMVRRHADWGLWLRIVSKDGMRLAEAPPEICSDSEIVFEAIRQNGLALQFADDCLKSSYEFITEAVKENPSALAHASREMRNDPKFVLDLVKLNGCALAGASETLRGDRRIVAEAVRQNEYAVLHAAQFLQRDPEFVQHLARFNAQIVSIAPCARALERAKDRFKSLYIR